MNNKALESAYEKLNELLEPLDAYDKEQVMKIMVETYKQGVQDGKYYAEGPKINLYGDRKGN